MRLKSGRPGFQTAPSVCMKSGRRPVASAAVSTAMRAFTAPEAIAKARST